MVKGIYDFARLSESQQYAYVWEYGTYLLSSFSGDIAFCLYAVGDFYVEIKYSQTSNLFEGLRVFKSVSHLERYFEYLPLPDDLVKP